MRKIVFLSFLTFVLAVGVTPSIAKHKTPQTTNLLFPFVTNQAGFDTGLIIANTGDDPLGTAGQSGACDIHYFGFTVGGGPAPAPVLTPTVQPGEHAVWTLSTGGTVQTSGGVIAAVPGFQGYVIAVCDFPLARGFSFLSDIGASRLAGTTLAEVIPDDRLRKLMKKKKKRKKKRRIEEEGIDY